ncbi:hypothetical protein LJC08_01550 [Methanimicrococcus sp. OttesenSCG-928-J09]|nr:hypothetical protein [Methanimicrococcus sp. OttesenSCG-928-J09]
MLLFGVRFLLPIGVRFLFCSGRAVFKKIASRFSAAYAAVTFVSHRRRARAAAFFKNNEKKYPVFKNNGKRHPLSKMTKKDTSY